MTYNRLLSLLRPANHYFHNRVHTPHTWLTSTTSPKISSQYLSPWTIVLRIQAAYVGWQAGDSPFSSRLRLPRMLEMGTKSVPSTTKGAKSTTAATSSTLVRIKSAMSKKKMVATTMMRTPPSRSTCPTRRAIIQSSTHLTKQMATLNPTRTTSVIFVPTSSNLRTSTAAHAPTSSATIVSATSSNPS